MNESAAAPALPFQVVILSGPSGSGKTTIVERLVADCSIPLVKAVSATTRPPRPGEQDGDAYYFLSDEEFQRRRAADEFLETAEVYGVGYWYGTLRSEVERARRAGAWSFLEIDVQGAMKVLESYPRALSIFLTTPSAEVFAQRLRARGTESEEVIQKRLRRAEAEQASADRYRFTVINDDLSATVAELKQILRTEAGQLAGPRT